MLDITKMTLNSVAKPVNSSLSSWWKLKTAPSLFLFLSHFALARRKIDPFSLYSLSFLLFSVFKFTYIHVLHGLVESGWLFLMWICCLGFLTGMQLWVLFEFTFCSLGFGPFLILRNENFLTNMFVVLFCFPSLFCVSIFRILFSFYFYLPFQVILYLVFGLNTMLFGYDLFLFYDFFNGFWFFFGVINETLND